MEKNTNISRFEDVIENVVNNKLILSFIGIELIWLMFCYVGYYNMSIGVKLLMLVVTIVIGNIPVVLCKLHNASRWLYEVSAMESLGSFLVGLSLCASGFANGFTSTEVLIAGLLVVLVYAYGSKSSMCMIIYYVLLGIGYFSDVLPIFNELYVLFLILSVPFGMLLFKARGLTKSFHVYLVVISIVWMFYFLYHEDRGVFGIWLYVVYAYFVVLYLLDMRISPKGKAYYLRPLRVMSYAGMCLVFFVGMLDNRWEQRVVASSNYGINVVFFVLMVVMCLFYIERILQGRITIEEILVCCLYYLSFAVYIFYEFYTAGSGTLMENYFVLVTIAFCVATEVRMQKHKNIFFSAVPVVVLIGYLYSLFAPKNGQDVILGVIGMVCLLTLLGIWRRKRI